LSRPVATAQRVWAVGWLVWRSKRITDTCGNW
jgi:hypothetical protein